MGGHPLFNAGCHFLPARLRIVRQSSEGIEVADSWLVEVDKTTDRAAAFVRLADEHLDAAYRLARAILRDPSEAQDATHDALLQAWRKWSTLRDPSRFEPWFDRILVNLCRNRLQQLRAGHRGGFCATSSDVK